MIARNSAAATIEPGQVLVISPDMLPLDGRAASGAGLRAWALGQGLRAHGLGVTFALPRATALAAGYQPDGQAEVFDESRLDAFLAAARPAGVVFQHWPLVNLLRRPLDGAWLAIDFHGPLLLETLFHSGTAVTGLYPQKLAALARADFFTCAGERQRNYFYAWLELAGFDLRSSPLEVVPFAWSPELPEHHYPAEPRFVFGGMFLPWQNPTRGLHALVTELEAAHRGQLEFFGGKHPRIQLEAPEFDRVLALLDASPRATVHPLRPRRELLETYARASVAWDVMSYNSERGMAITSRTVEYLWAGLPVVYQRYAELADDIARYEAGWLVDPEDEAELRVVVRQILASPAEIVRRGQNAQRLVAERRNWTSAIEPLARFALSPSPAARLSPGPLWRESGSTRLARRVWRQMKRAASVNPTIEAWARRGWQSARRALVPSSPAAGPSPPAPHPRPASAGGPHFTGRATGPVSTSPRNSLG